VASREEQDLRRRIEFLTRQLETSDGGEPRVREPAVNERLPIAVRRDLELAQADYARLLIRLRDADPAYATMVSGRTRSWREVSKRLKPDEVLLEYMITDSASTVFVVTADTLVAIDLRATRKDLSDLVEFSRKAIEKRPSGKANDLWRAPLRRLHSRLIKPVGDRGYLRGKRKLLIAPHGELHLLSFASLIIPGNRDRFLVENFQISYAPSATVWMELEERRHSPPSSSVLALAPNVSRLPASRLEAMSISRIYGRNAQVKYGASATVDALRSMLPAAGVIHFATFGVLNKHNPLFSFIELAPTSTDDGRLEVNEVFGLNLSGQLVVLSACQTGLASGALADVPPGDDWVGLVQAFIQAGARGVVASLWPVEDVATGMLMEEFHKRLASGISPSMALAGAQRAMILDPRKSSPFYWAAFTVNGRAE
jgi:CHAT domain-containing protein